MTEDIPETRQPEARAVCEHFYASHCYRGMSIRLCMTCHEPDWDDLERQLRGAAGDTLPLPSAAPLPLIMPADEFAAVKTAARMFGAVATKPCGCGPDEPCDAHAEKDPPGSLHEVADAFLAVLLAADQAVSAQRDRADAAEAKLAEVRGVLLEGGQDAGTVRRRALAIIGTEEEGRG